MEAILTDRLHHAQNNPDAVAYGHPVDHTRYENSRWISEPLHLFDCSREK